MFYPKTQFGAQLSICWEYFICQLNCPLQEMSYKRDVIFPMPNSKMTNSSSEQCHEEDVCQEADILLPEIGRCFIDRFRETAP